MATTKLADTSITAWVAFLDVYGFSSLLRSGNQAEIFSQLLRATGAAQSELSKCHHRVAFYFFSDSAYIVYPIEQPNSVTAVLHICFEDISRLMSIYAYHDLPLRGGIARGTVNFADNIVVGDAVLKAYEYEKLIVAPLVLAPTAQLPDPTKDKGAAALLLRAQSVPVRGDGLIHAIVVTPEDGPEFMRFANKRYQQALLEGPYDVASAWRLARTLVRRGMNRPRPQ